MKSKRVKSKRVKSKRVKSKRVKSKRVSKRKKSYSATGIALWIGIPIALGFGGLGYYYKKLPGNQLRQEAPPNNLPSVINYDENEIDAYLYEIVKGSIIINRNITEAQLRQYMKDILPGVRDIQKKYKYRVAAISIKRLALDSINEVNTDYEEQFIRNPASVGSIYITRN